MKTLLYDHFLRHRSHVDRSGIIPRSPIPATDGLKNGTETLSIHRTSSTISVTESAGCRLFICGLRRHIDLVRRIETVLGLRNLFLEYTDAAKSTLIGL